MKNKSITMVGFSILAVLFLFSLASANLTFSNIPTLSSTGNSATITLTSDVNETVVFSISNIEYQGRTISFSPISSRTFEAGVPQSISINYNIESGFNFEFGEDFSTTLSVSGSSSPSKTQELSFATTSFCEVSNAGNLDVSIEDISVSGFSDDENEWYPLDEIEIELEIQNNGNEDIENIEVSWCLFDTKNNECVIDDDEPDFDVNEDDEEKITITFKVDPDDLDSDITDYEFHVKATGEITDGVNEGEDTCGSDKENVEMIIGGDFVVLDSIDFLEIAQCGADIQVSADVWNIGEDDQEDVEVRIFNSDLKIDQRISIGDVDSFENEAFDTIIRIPSDAKEGSHTLRFSVLDEDGDLFESEDDEDSEFTEVIKVDSCNANTPSSSVSISAVLESGNMAGQELVVKSSITNSGNSQETYTLTATGYDSWASSPSIEPSVVIIPAGESRDVTYKFNVNEDASGSNSFRVVATSSNGVSTSQQVSINLEESKGFSFGGITGLAISEDNWYLWGIGLINLILVIVIIVVAVRIARS